MPSGVRQLTALGFHAVRGALSRWVDGTAAGPSIMNKCNVFPRGQDLIAGFFGLMDEMKRLSMTPAVERTLERAADRQSAGMHSSGKR